MGQQPVSDGSSFLIEVFCLGHEVQFRDIDAGRTDQVAKTAADAEVNPTVRGSFSGRPKSLDAGAGLLGSGEVRVYPGNRADSLAGRTPQTNIRIVSGPILLYQYGTFLGATLTVRRGSRVSAHPVANRMDRDYLILCVALRSLREAIPGRRKPGGDFDPLS